MKQIPLGDNLFALVDDWHYERIVQFGRWRYLHDRHTYYAISDIPSIMVRMHQLIIPVPKGMVIDHLDGKGYNNQEYNLRAVTLSQNRHNGKAPITNTSGCRGIEQTSTGMFRGRITVNGTSHRTMCFETFSEAVQALVTLRKKLLGDFSTLDIFDQNTEYSHNSKRSRLLETLSEFINGDNEETSNLSEFF